ncbi:MAG: efflux transporter outer membrane subunit, partial [Deltaproteobacteria bacterium]|nr:efflux transporter outer membrane subunit [Deltaproteobacteria bacterium]
MNLLKTVKLSQFKNSIKLKTAVSLGVIGMALLFVMSCNLFKPDSKAQPEKILPKTFSLYSGEADHSQQWWKSFNDAELNALVDAALSDSFSLKAAWARLNQARALSVQAGAGRYPDLTGTATAFTGRQKISANSSETNRIEEYGMGLVSSYELDLWGRVRSQHKSVMLQAVASREDLNTAAITLAAEVANRWIAIIAQRMQKQLLTEQLRINETLLELVELRFRKAMVSALDVYQQKQVVQKKKAEIPLVEEQEQLLQHELAVLLGRPPRATLKINRIKLPKPSPLPPTGLPADLLSARPDIRAAWSRLNASDWQIAAARANRMPALSLTAQARYVGGDIDILFDQWLMSLAANLTAPILDGGRRAAEVDRTRAVADENLALYYNKVLTAIKEVEDALVSEAKKKEHLEGLQKATATAGLALEEAEIRYSNGITDYLPVLTQLTIVQGLERDLIQRQAGILNARIQLYRAIGGTWTEDL